MINRRRARWLDAALEGWVEAGLVSADQARALRHHTTAEGGRGAAVPLFAVLGAGLIGLGVILLLAHNWESLSRGVRAALSLGLVLAGQGLAVRAALRHRASVAWTEGGAVAATLAFAAGFALIGQTYQIQGDLQSFLATWWWVSLPVVYALESRAAAVLVLFQAMGLYLASFVDEQPDSWHWLRLAALLPFFWMLRARAATGPREALAATLLLLAIAGSALLGAIPLGGMAIVLTTALLAAGLHGVESADPWVARVAGASARGLGLLGASALVFWLGIGELWEILDFDGADEVFPASLVPSAAVLLAGAGLAIARAARARGEERISSWIVAGAPVATVLAAGLAGGLDDEDTGRLAASLVMSAYGLALGTSEVLRGIRGGERFHANLGMSLLLFVIGQRFLSWEWSFTARGIAFIVAGTAFLLLNLEIRRRARLASEEDSR